MKRPQNVLSTSERKIPRSGTDKTPDNYSNHRVNICTRTNERRFTVPYKNEIENNTNYLKQIIKAKLQTTCTDQNANFRCVNFADTQVFVDYMVFDRRNGNERIKYARHCHTPKSSVDQDITTIPLDSKGQIPNFCEGLGNGTNIKRSVFIPVVVNTYTPNRTEHNSHVINAFKHNSILYCFNPWGGAVTRALPDADIFEKIRVLYRCSRKIVYKGAYLQLHDHPSRGSCASWGSFFGEMMYNLLLQDTNMIDSNNNTIMGNSTNSNSNNTNTNRIRLSMINTNTKLGVLIAQQLHPGSQGFTPDTFFKRVRMKTKKRDQHQNLVTIDAPIPEYAPIQRRYVKPPRTGRVHNNIRIRRELLG